MKEEIEIKNAVIISTKLGYTEFDCLMLCINLEYDGSSQSTGYFALGVKGSEFIMKILKIVKVNDWSDLKGKYVRVKATEEKIYEIGNIIEDEWLCFRDFFKKGVKE